VQHIADIVLVDDEVEILEELRDYLRMRGYGCDLAHSGAEFFDVWERKGPYRLVITDIRMPDLGGIELLRRLRERDVNVPVVVVTGHAGEDEAAKALTSGASAVLQKPLDLRVLRRTIEDCGVHPGK
jgi:DNA-binding NtrC family response regulator